MSTQQLLPSAYSKPFVAVNLVGGAGCGKSTLLEWLQQQSFVSQWSNHRTPLPDARSSRFRVAAEPEPLDLNLLTVNGGALYRSTPAIDVYLVMYAAGDARSLECARRLAAEVRKAVEAPRVLLLENVKRACDAGGGGGALPEELCDLEFQSVSALAGEGCEEALMKLVSLASAGQKELAL